MNIPTTTLMHSTFKNMPNIRSITLQNTDNVENTMFMCENCTFLTKEPIGINYTKLIDGSFMYRGCKALRRSQAVSFPVATILEGAYQDTLSDEFTSYTINAPLASSLRMMLYNVPQIHNTTINVGNPSVSIDSLAKYDVANQSPCEITINSPAPLTGPSSWAFYNRAKMKQFPYGVKTSGDTVTLSLHNSTISYMFTNCSLLKLPTTNAINNAIVEVPNATNAISAFNNTYIWGNSAVNLRLKVTIQLDNAVNIAQSFRVPSKPSGSINHLTMTAPKASTVNYCVGSLMAKAGYSLRFLNKNRAFVYHKDIEPFVTLRHQGAIRDEMLKDLRSWTGSVLITDCPEFHPNYISSMRYIRALHLRNCTIVNNGNAVVQKPNRIPLSIYVYAYKYTAEDYVSNPNWRSLTNLKLGLYGVSPSRPGDLSVSSPEQSKWFLIFPKN